jgi:type IV pilus assembly protein PilB
MTSKKRLGEMLLDAGVIDETQLKAALGHQRQWGMRLGQALVDLKLAAEEDVVRALSVKFGFEVARLDALEPHAHAEALKLFPREFALRNNVFPMAADTATLTVAMSDPTNLAVVDEIRFRTGRRVKALIGGDQEVASAIRRSYRSDPGVEAIALDLEAEGGIAGEPMFDPFGGGSAGAAGDGRTASLDLEDAEELTPLDDGPGEPILAADLAPSGAEEGADAAAELTRRELAILESLDSAAGEGAEADVVKPARAVGALIRLLIRKGLVTEEELLDELRSR